LAIEPGENRLRERGLVAAFRSGSPGAFEEIVRIHRRRLFAIALRRTGDAETAEDAVQVALTKAWKSLPRMEGEVDLAAWLTTVVQNAALDRIRSEDRQGRLAERAFAAAPERPDRSGAGRPVETPGTTLDRSELGGILLDAISALPQPYRVALELFHVQGLSVEDVSRVLELNENTVKSHLARGRAILRRRLGARLERGGWL
jgi:RNA polymerase sigma-70 factor (ECF subfamily)